MTVETLIDRIWGDRPPARASHTLYADVPKLRRAPTHRARCGPAHVGDNLQTTEGSLVTVVALRDYTATMVTYDLTIDSLHELLCRSRGHPGTGAQRQRRRRMRTERSEPECIGE